MSKAIELSEKESSILEDYLFKKLCRLKDSGLEDSDCYKALMSVRNKIRQKEGSFMINDFISTLRPATMRHKCCGKFAINKNGFVIKCFNEEDGEVRFEDGSYVCYMKADKFDDSLTDKVKRCFGLLNDELIMAEASIELDFDGFDEDAANLAKEFNCICQFVGQANGYPIYKFVGKRESLKELAVKYGMDEEEFSYFIREAL